MTTGFGFCATCGTPRLAADQKFCAVCGSALAPFAPPAPVQAAPPPAPAPVAPPPFVPPAPEPVVADAAAGPAPDVEAAIPAPPAPEVAASDEPAAPPPWATIATPPAVEAPPAPVAPPVAPPPAWSVPPAAAQSAPAAPPAPPAWSAPAAPTYQAPPAYQQAPPPAYQPGAAYPPAPPVAGAPAAAGSGFKITPQLLLIGAVVLAVIAGAFYYLNMSSASSTLTFSPSTVSCSKPVAFTTTVHLPASVKAGDTITITMNGKNVATGKVSEISDMAQGTDGSWSSTSTTTVSEMQTLCAAGGSAGGIDILSPGPHTMQVLDSSGKVVASGSYTVTP